MKRQMLCALVVALPAGLALAQGTDPDFERGTNANFQALDANTDGRVSSEEASVDEVLSEVFTKADKNADGYVDGSEYKRYAKARAKAMETPQPP